MATKRQGWCGWAATLLVTGAMAVGASAQTPYTGVAATLTCSEPLDAHGMRPALGHVTVSIAGATASAVSDDHGRVVIASAGAQPNVTLKVAYEGAIAQGLPSGPPTPLQVMDDVHNTRSEEVRASGTVNGGVLELGTLQLTSLDCELWEHGVSVLTTYHTRIQKAPPAGRLRIHRWENVVVGTPMTYYNYVTIPADFRTSTEYPGRRDRVCTVAHEFGHTVRHVFDGDKTHWDGDVIKYAYGRSHNDSMAIFNVQYTFNEGWADYWEAATAGCGLPAGPPSNFRDWNEYLVGAALVTLDGKVGTAAMVRTLELNPGGIHSLHEFEQALHRVVPTSPVPPSVGNCPPGYVDDGATCRHDAATAKPSRARGAGTPLSSCPAGTERDGTLCYPTCPAGFHGVGPVCWGSCPAGYHDDGATCRRDAHIISADNSACPLIDKCGLTFNKGCSKCPSGFKNDGCTCRADLDITAKLSHGRGAGRPMGCAPGQEQNGGLCYAACPVGFTGAGPVCWGACPANSRDDGATCYTGTSVVIK